MAKTLRFRRALPQNRKRLLRCNTRESSSAARWISAQHLEESDAASIKRKALCNDSVAYLAWRRRYQLSAIGVQRNMRCASRRLSGRSAQGHRLRAAPSARRPRKPAFVLILRGRPHPSAGTGWRNHLFSAHRVTVFASRVLLVLLLYRALCDFLFASLSARLPGARRALISAHRHFLLGFYTHRAGIERISRIYRKTHPFSRRALSPPSFARRLASAASTGVISVINGACHARAYINVCAPSPALCA